MWKPIEIKPNDQSLVGKMIKYEEWQESGAITILYVGCKHMFTKDPSMNDRETSWPLSDNWLIYDPAPQREIVKMAPALTRWLISPVGTECFFEATRRFFESEQYAKDYLGSLFYSWPAPQPDAEGFYAIEREVQGE